MADIRRPLSDEDFEAIEAASGYINIPESLRSLIRGTCRYQLEHIALSPVSGHEVIEQAEATLNQAKLLRGGIRGMTQKSLHKREALFSIYMNALGDHNDSVRDIDNNKFFHPKRFDHLLDAHIAILERTAEMAGEIYGKRGAPPHELRKFIEFLMAIYEAVGGKATACRKGAADEYDGPFVRFVVEVVKRGLHSHLEDCEHYNEDAIRTATRSVTRNSNLSEFEMTDNEARLRALDCQTIGEMMEKARAVDEKTTEKNIEKAFPLDEKTIKEIKRQALPATLAQRLCASLPRPAGKKSTENC